MHLRSHKLHIGHRAGSNFSPHAKLLDNRLAYEVLEAVYQVIPAGTRGGPALDDPLYTPAALHDYQNWIHERLHSSGLDKALAGGPDFLPDITAELPPLWRWLARLLAPRSYRHLARQVLRNLAWYLGRGDQPVTPVHALKSSFVPACLVSLLVLPSLAITTGFGSQPWPMLLLSYFILLGIVFTVVWVFGQDSGGRFKANCAELYAYLLAAYAEPGPRGENRVPSVLEELGRDTDNSNAAIARRARKSYGGSLQS